MQYKSRTNQALDGFHSAWEQKEPLQARDTSSDDTDAQAND